MCYGNVTKWLYSLLLFTNNDILLEFYDVRHCEPGKNCYLYVTFLDCLNCGGLKKRAITGTRPAPFSTCHYYLSTSLSLNAISYQSTILMTSVVPAGLWFFFAVTSKILFPQSSLHNFTEPKKFTISLVLTLFLRWINEKVHFKKKRLQGAAFSIPLNRFHLRW